MQVFSQILYCVKSAHKKVEKYIVSIPAKIAENDIVSPAAAIRVGRSGEDGLYGRTGGGGVLNGTTSLGGSKPPQGQLTVSASRIEENLERMIGEALEMDEQQQVEANSRNILSSDPADVSILSNASSNIVAKNTTNAPLASGTQIFCIYLCSSNFGTSKTRCYN